MQAKQNKFIQVAVQPSPGKQCSITLSVTYYRKTNALIPNILPFLLGVTKEGDKISFLHNAIMQRELKQLYRVSALTLTTRKCLGTQEGYTRDSYVYASQKFKVNRLFRCQTCLSYNNGIFMNVPFINI